MCNCNGLSETCFYNQTLFEFTGNGGYCINCRGNTEGPHCDYCKFSFYKDDYDQCVDCACDPLGSLSQQCDPNGECRCKPGVNGLKCDRCKAGYYDLTFEGCKKCACSEIGSYDNPYTCDPVSGQCRCKQNVEGQNCDR